MDWTVRHAPGFSQSKADYKSSLSDRLSLVVKESPAQKVLLDIECCEAFINEIDDFASKRTDPAQLRPAREKWRKIPNWHYQSRFSLYAYYHRDPVLREAVAVLFFRWRDRP